MLRKSLLAAIIFSPIAAASVKYEVVKAEVKPFVSNSFSNGYLGLQEKPVEPGVGVFFEVKALTNKESEVMDLVSRGDVNGNICGNIFFKSLLDALYTVNIKYLDESGREVISTGFNKKSCVNVNGVK
ncbi:hypothetical protein RGJ20_001000 [Serratia marcescens]